jgi:hypothetical protein
VTEIKMSKPEVDFGIQDGDGRHLGFSVNGYNSGKYGRILMKFDTHTRDMIPRLKIAKPDVASEIQNGCCHRLEFNIICCRFIANCPISTKFCKHIHVKVHKRKKLILTW